MKDKLISLFKVLVIFGILCFVFICFVNIYIEKYSNPYINKEDVGKVDAVIILGAKVSGDTVSWVLQERLDTGYGVYLSGKADKIIVSGDHGQAQYDEANAMRKYLMGKGVPREDIFMDHAGFDTYASMYRAKEVFCVESAIVTSQDYHNARAVFIGRKLGIETYAVNADDVYIGKYRFIREPLARVKAFFETTFKVKPKYIGDTIPVWGDGSTTDDGKS